VHPDSNYRQGVCRACDRYIGAVNVCPYCDERVVRPLPLRVLRFAALALAIGGLVILYAAARIRDRPTVRVDSLTPLMNYAPVNVQGTVDRNPYVGRDENGEVDYASFRVHDGSGWIRVATYGGAARALVDSEVFPSKGDEVNVTGKLQFSQEGEPKLRLADPRQVRRVGD